MTTKRILEIKVTLREIAPPVWRRIRVSSETSLARLHEVIQIAMGWKNKHLHEFDTEFGRFGMKNDYGHEVLDERPVRIGEILKLPKHQLGYWYDFGDDWWHDVVLEREVASDPGVKYPQVVAGERACPPEDCGGPHGYNALCDPAHRDHKSFMEWVGGKFSPEAFDVHERNALLHKLGRPKTVAHRRSR